MTMPKIHPSITADRVMEAIAADNYTGFCLSCGAEAEMCEPDTRRRKCECCGERAVYGAEQLLITFEPELI